MTSMPIGLKKSSERDQMKTDATFFGRKLFIDKSFKQTHRIQKINCHYAQKSQ